MGDATLVERVAGIGRVWRAVELFHPALRSGEIDWQTRCLSAWRRAVAGEDHATVLADLLAPLADPLTRVLDAHDPEPRIGAGAAFHAIEYTSWPAALPDAADEATSDVPQVFGEDARWLRRVAGADGERVCDRVDASGGVHVDVRMVIPCADPAFDGWRAALLQVERIAPRAATVATPEDADELRAVRILDACGIWGMVELLYPYADLMDEPWDACWMRALDIACDPATDAATWRAALRDLLAATGDGGHIGYEGARIGSSEADKPARRMDTFERPHGWALLGEEEIPYVDVARIPIEHGSRAIRTLRATGHGIIDIRGYPQFFDLFHTLAVEDVIGARYREPTARGIAPDRRSWLDSTSFQHAMPRAGEPAPRVVLTILIDERAQSSAEHMCLWLAAQCDVEFVGTPTSGANGQVTYVPTSFGWFQVSGGEVRWPDGRQLQRVGVQPHHVVEPGTDGMGTVLDAVLDAALARHRVRVVAASD